MEAYAELQTTTNFSFLRGGSHPHELAGTMAEFGYRAFGVADRNTLAGVVRAWEAAGKAGIRCLSPHQPGPLLPIARRFRSPLGDD